MHKQINYNFSIKLNNYDLINKFNIKSIYELPVYTKIELKTFIKENSIEKTTRLQLESFFLFYILGLNKIYLKFNYITQSAIYLRSTLIESELKSVVLKQLVFDFLFNFYLLLNKFFRSCILSKGPLNFSKNGKPKNKNFNLISYLPGDLLLEKREQTLINFNDLKVFICFNLTQPIIYYSKKRNIKNFNLDLDFFKNIFPFWIFS